MFHRVDPDDLPLVRQRIKMQGPASDFHGRRRRAQSTTLIFLLTHWLVRAMTAAIIPPAGSSP
jgi:hypothetical protein